MVELHISEYRELVDVLHFLNRCLLNCKGKPVLITDGGPWYLWPAQHLGLEHMVVSGGDRNYIERWFKTLKNRLSRFDRYFPTERLSTVRNFTAVFCLWYNYCRRHMSIRGPPSGGKGGLEKWMEVLS